MHSHNGTYTRKFSKHERGLFDMYPRRSKLQSIGTETLEKKMKFCEGAYEQCKVECCHQALVFVV
jgi:hypothetical protein